ncbi:MAG TPA: hypothetical protein ENK23_00680 [Sorangium sp.]|nr:hypothetical protein [Sorangium sp.]
MQAACHGGIDRTSVACAQAQLAMGHVLAAQKEMARLRRLRGDPAILRGDELVALLTTGRRAEAMAIYRALSPGERSLALLGAWYQNRPGEGARLRAILRENLATASDAPAALEPLARLLGHVPDLSFGFEQDGAELVAQDRAQAFLPGAGTAVLKRVEWYDLEASGLLHYWLYDLRRVSGTSDVAGGTWYGAPMVDGRGAARLLRRRIYKKDGRVVDPDPRASGRQDQTDLSQLQTGDYVEVVMEGWGLPSEQGQLVVDSADVLPRRTSLRSLDIRFRRPRAVKLALWAHPRLGRGTTHQQGDTITTRWQLHDQPPRTFEEGVPPLEARVAISFGSDSYARIGRAFGDALRGLSEQDPYVTRWVHDATAGAHSARERIDKLVAAVGKTIARSDQYLLSDGAAAWAVGPQRLTARTMLERGEGSRCWVIHRGLQVLGIDSTIAIAESRPFSAAPNFPPRPGRFSHALVRATVDGATLWIDADVDGPPLPPGHISPELRSRKALLASGKILEVSATTQADADVLEVALTLQPNGDARGHFTAQIHGRAAQQLSLALEDEVGPQRTERLRHVVLGWLPWADVKKVKLAASSTSWRIALEADIAVVGLAQPQARGSALYTIVGVRPLHGVYPRGQASSLAGQYARHAARTTPLAINAPQLYRFTRTITLPAGSRLVRTPAAAELTALGISAQRLVTVAGRRLRDTFVFNLPVTTIAAKDYATFAASARAIDDAFLYSYGVELPPQP